MNDCWLCLNFGKNWNRFFPWFLISLATPIKKYGSSFPKLTLVFFSGHFGTVLISYQGISACFHKHMSVSLICRVIADLHTTLSWQSHPCARVCYRFYFFLNNSQMSFSSTLEFIRCFYFHYSIQYVELIWNFFLMPSTCELYRV